MAKQTSQATDTIATRYVGLVADKYAQIAATQTIPNITVTAPKVTPKDGIEPLDLPHVHAGDLITAGFVNDIVDAVIDLDARLQRIENLLARLLDREDANASPPGKS